VEKVLDPEGRPIQRPLTRYDLLTDREREVLKLLAEGCSMKDVARRLERSLKTAQAHTYNLMHKLGVHRRADLTRYAIAHGLVEATAPEDLGEEGAEEPSRREDARPSR
jgi:DNA-binding NarL/FixJ family response regulator